MTRTRRAGELWFALALLAFALVALWQAYGIAGFASLSSPGIFPMLAAATMVGASLAVVRATARQAPGGTGRSFLAEVLPARLIMFLAFIAAFLAAMPWLGFMPAAALFLYVAIAALWRRGLVKPALVTALALACIYVTFRLAFQIVLPRGVLIPALL